MERRNPPADTFGEAPPERVLVIDDEPDVLLLCRLNMEIAGREVLEAPDGEQGMGLALRHRPHSSSST